MLFAAIAIAAIAHHDCVRRGIARKRRRRADAIDTLSSETAETANARLPGLQARGPTGATPPDHSQPRECPPTPYGDRNGSTNKPDSPASVLAASLATAPPTYI